MDGSGFPQAAVEAICRHMNEDHREDALLICRTLGGAPEAVDAEAVHVDAAGMAFRSRRPDGGDRTTTVAFASPVVERAEVRGAVVELYERACAAAGSCPRAR